MKPYIQAGIAFVSSALFWIVSPMSSGDAEELTTVVAFGDSITKGFGVPAGAGWVERLPALLKQKSGREISVFNAGVSGNTAADGLRRLQADVLIHMPALVLVEFGGNDAGRFGCRPEAVDAFETNILDICRQVKDKGGKIALVTFSPVVNERHTTNKNPDYAEWDGCVEAYRQRTRELAQRLGCPLFDLDAFLRTLMKKIGRERIMAPDGLHLTEEANEAIANEIPAFVLDHLQL